MSKKLLVIIFMIIVMITTSFGTVLAVTAPKATTKPPAALAPDYKGVVFYADNLDFEMSPEAFSGNYGTKETMWEKNHGVAMHLPYCWAENMGIAELETTPAIKKRDLDDQKIAPRYFRVNLAKADKVGAKADANFRAAIAAGQSPLFNFAYDPANIPTGPNSLPKNTTKVFMSALNESFSWSKKVKTDPEGQATKFVAVVAAGAKKIHAAVPKATIYIPNMKLGGQFASRLSKPEIMERWVDIFPLLMSISPYLNDTNFKNICNRKIKELCAANGYVYVDTSKFGLTDANGWLMDKYVHPTSHGGHMSKEATTIYGDKVCAIMGLKSAKVAYNLK